MAPRYACADGVMLSELSSTLNNPPPNTTLHKVVPPLPLCMETPGTQNHSHYAPHDMGRSVFEALCEAEACLVSAERHSVSPGKLAKGEPIGKGGFSVVFRCVNATFVKLNSLHTHTGRPRRPRRPRLLHTLSPRRLFTPPAQSVIVVTITTPPAVGPLRPYTRARPPVPLLPPPHRCTRPDSKHEYALKQMHKVPRYGPGAAAQAAMAQHELDAHAELPPHPFVVAMHCYWQDERSVYLLLELCACSLYDAFFAPGDDDEYYGGGGARLPEDAVKVYVGSVALALRHLHRHGFVFLDLKLENVLLTTEVRSK